MMEKSRRQELEATSHIVLTFRRVTRQTSVSVYVDQDPSEEKVPPPTVGRFSHLSECNQNNPLQAHPQATSEVVLGSAKLTVNSNYHNKYIPKHVTHDTSRFQKLFLSKKVGTGVRNRKWAKTKGGCGEEET